MTNDAFKEEPAAPVTRCDGCHGELKPDDVVAAGQHYELKPSTSGKGTTKHFFGYSVTHRNHWPPMGGATHDASPEWTGLLKDLAGKFRRA